MKTLYLIICTLLVFGCSSDDLVDPESLLPPITSTGENTFGAIVDGKFFRPRDGRISVAGPSPGMVIRSTETVNVEYDINDYKSERTGNLLIHLESFENNNTKIYQLDESNGLRGLDGNNHNYAHGRFWSEKHQRYHNFYSFYGSGSVEVHNDLILNSKDIHASTFAIKLVNISDSSDTLAIRQGRFDVDSFTISSKNWD